VTILRIALVLLVAGCLFSCVDWWRLGQRVDQTTADIRSDFLQGTSFDLAQPRAKATYPESTIYPAADCEHWSHHGVPAFPAQGGQCIFGIKRVGETWWGFQAAVSFRLMFTPTGSLATIYTYPVYTFL
jgi:hypothetical protein